MHTIKNVHYVGDILFGYIKERLKGQHHANAKIFMIFR